MKPILTFLILLIFSFTLFAGGISSSPQKIYYKIISFKSVDGYTKEFIKEADMMITLTLNPNNEFVYMENRWLNFNSSSVGALVKTTTLYQYSWNPINSYDNEHNECMVTTFEKLINRKYIRTFWIDVNHGKEKLVIVAEKIS